MLNGEKNRIVAEVFLAVEENNNGKDSHKKTTKKKRQDKKPLCYQGRHQVDGYLEFRIALIHPHPRLPAPSLAMAGNLCKNRVASRLSNSVAASNCRTPLRLERKRHITSNQHGCSREGPFTETPPGENFLSQKNGSFSSQHKSVSPDQHWLCILLF